VAGLIASNVASNPARAILVAVFASQRDRPLAIDEAGNIRCIDWFEMVGFPIVGHPLTFKQKTPA
jgi:hypothetical protein